MSNSLTSFANSSSNSGNSFFFISCNFTLNVASFPAKSFEKYSSGNFTFMSFSSSILMPIIWSSKPGINVLLPISSSCFSAFPPSNAFPSTNPSKSITVIPCLAGNVHYLCHTITPIHRFPSTSHELNSNLPANLTDAKLLLSYVKLSGKFGGVSTARHLRSATATVPPSRDCGLRRVRGGHASRRSRSPR